MKYYLLHTSYTMKHKRFIKCNIVQSYGSQRYLLYNLWMTNLTF